MEKVTCLLYDDQLIAGLERLGQFSGDAGESIPSKGDRHSGLETLETIGHRTRVGLPRSTVAGLRWDPMAVIRRLADSCITVTTQTGVTLIDPGFSTFDSGEIDLATIGDVSRVLVTHEHSDHVKPEFVSWLIDRRADVTVHSNQAVADLLRGHDIGVITDNPPGVTAEDVLHGMTPAGTSPPNRSYTVEGLLTHPGDSQEPTLTAPVLALPLLAPWTSTTAAVAFARRLRPQMVIPIHDFHLGAGGRQFLASMAAGALKADGIEVVPLGWGESIEI